MKQHGLPGEPGESIWFGRMNTFEQQETKRQVAFKRNRWPGLSDGVSAKHKSFTYPHLLPDDDIDKALYPGIAVEVRDYFQSEKIAVHSEFRNLKSSQACCFNVLFPLRRDLPLAAIALAPVLPGVKAVTQIEFEYTGPESATSWLGEPANGQRGQYRTSIDAAIWWQTSGERFLTFVEWKYTEKTYGECGGYKSRGNKHQNLCETLSVSSGAPATGCYLTEGRNTRRYWEHLAEAGIDLASLSRCTGCPFRGPFYQLMRQHLLAAYCRKRVPVKDVFVASIGFRDNTSLHKAPPELEALGPTVEDAWNAGLSGVLPMTHVAVEDIMACTRAAGRPADREWLAYLAERYGV